MFNEASTEMIDQSSNFSIDSKIGVDHVVDDDNEMVDSDNEMADSDIEMESSSDSIIKEADDDDGNSNYMVEKEVLSYRRIKADLKASRRLRKKHQAKLKTMKAWSNLSSSVTPSKSTSSSPASALPSIPPSSSSQHSSSLSLPLSIIERNSWTILTDLSVLKSNGYRGQYYRKKLQLPLPVKFRTPRYSQMKATVHCSVGECIILYSAIS